MRLGLGFAALGGDLNGITAACRTGRRPRWRRRIARGAPSRARGGAGAGWAARLRNDRQRRIGIGRRRAPVAATMAACGCRRARQPARTEAAGGSVRIAELVGMDGDSVDFPRFVVA